MYYRFQDADLCYFSEIHLHPTTWASHPGWELITDEVR
jgi:hypothetical protein